MHSNLVYTSIVSKTLITPGCLSVLDLRTAFFANGSRDLFSRISSGANADSSNGRLPRNDVESDEYSFKGAARNQPENGFSFLGASKAKELFPYVNVTLAVSDALLIAHYCRLIHKEKGNAV